MTQRELKIYWDQIPIGRGNAAKYWQLMTAWNTCERQTRKILHELSVFDSGDDYILIRSAQRGGGFYRTTAKNEIEAFKRECLHKGRSLFAPIRKINRVLGIDETQISLFEDNDK